MDYYLSVKRNEVLMPVTMRMNLENMLSEISQAQKDYISYDHTYTTHLEIVKFTATEDRMVVTRD